MLRSFLPLPFVLTELINEFLSPCDIFFICVEPGTEHHIMCDVDRTLCNRSQQHMDCVPTLALKRTLFILRAETTSLERFFFYDFSPHEDLTTEKVLSAMDLDWFCDCRKVALERNLRKFIDIHLLSSFLKLT
jgi:hypothetical protein